VPLARDASFGGPPLALIDYGREPFSAALFLTLARRIAAEAATVHARGRALYAPAPLAQQATEILMAAVLAAITAHGNAADVDIAIEAGADELLADRSCWPPPPKSPPVRSSSPPRPPNAPCTCRRPWPPFARGCRSMPPTTPHWSGSRSP
jgi:hypothetical protein